MTIYMVVVTRETTPNSLHAVLIAKYPDDHLWVMPNVCLVAASGAPKEISDSLGISEGTTATGIVASMGGYFGRAPTNVWDWIKAKWEQTSDK